MAADAAGAAGAAGAAAGHLVEEAADKAAVAA